MPQRVARTAGPRIKSALPVHVEHDLAIQRQRLIACWEDTTFGLRSPLAEFDAAVLSYRQLAERVRLNDHGSLLSNCVSVNPRNVVRLIEMDDENGHRFEAVKFEGHTNGLGEAEALQAFMKDGLPCVEPRFERVERVHVDGRSVETRVFSSRYVSNSMLLAEQSPAGPFADRLDLLQSLTNFLVPFHRTAARVAAPKSWMAYLARQLNAVSSIAAANKRPLPRFLASSFRDLASSCRGSKILLHGRPDGGQIVVSGDKKWLIGPGKWIGPPEGQVGHLIAEVAMDPAEIPALIDAAVSADPILDRLKLTCFSGFASLFRTFRPKIWHGNASGEVWTNAGLELANSFLRKQRA